MKIYLYILIQLEGGPSSCFQYTFSIKYGITCSFGPFTTFIHYDTISRFQYQNIYKTKSKFVKKVSNIFHECKVGAFREALTLTLNRCSIFLRTYSLSTYAMIKQRTKYFMLSGSIQLSLHFRLSKSCIFLNRCLCIIFSMTNAVQYIYVDFHFVYIQITIHWSFQSCSFICNKSFKHKSYISQFSFHFSLK